MLHRSLSGVARCEEKYVGACSLLQYSSSIVKQCMALAIPIQPELLTNGVRVGMPGCCKCRTLFRSLLPHSSSTKCRRSVHRRHSCPMSVAKNYRSKRAALVAMLLGTSSNDVPEVVKHCKAHNTVLCAWSRLLQLPEQEK